MVPDLADTIAAIGTARGGAGRGMIRLSGPGMLDCLAGCFDPTDYELRLESVNSARLITGKLRLRQARLPCDVYLWPGERSYTRQPSAELHTLGSPPLLESVLDALCRQGARIAEPGEFTLRAFLAGRLDLTQAEAVLGIIDASSSVALKTALAQLAGGLSQPLALLREQLITLLAHLEAGLDFVEEDIEFISDEELTAQLSAAMKMVNSVLKRLATRNQPIAHPRVVLVGPPNAGKSSLFNALLKLGGVKKEQVRALVSELAGTTRDYLSATVDLGGLRCELIDTAGTESGSSVKSIEGFAQEMTADQSNQADCRILCIEASDKQLTSIVDDTYPMTWNCLAVTKGDLTQQVPEMIRSNSRAVLCSSFTGAGLPELQRIIVEAIAGSEKVAAEGVAATAARCSENLRSARESLQRALETLAFQGGEELVAADVRAALDDLGRVVGAVYTDDVLDRIFSQFCIGK